MIEHFWKIFITLIMCAIVGGVFLATREKTRQTITEKVQVKIPVKPEIKIKNIQISKKWDCSKASDSVKSIAISLLFDCIDNNDKLVPEDNSCVVPEDNSCVDMRGIKPAAQMCRNSVMTSICPIEIKFQTCFTNDSCSILKACDSAKTDAEILACQRG